MTNSKEKWLQVSFLSELITGTVLALWIIFTELTRLDVYFSVVIGLILYIIFIGSLVYRKHSADKLQLEKLRTQRSSEDSKTFIEKVQAPLSLKFNESQIREDTIRKAIRTLEDALKDDKLSKEKKETYEEIINRLKDFARAYSPF